VIRAIEAATGVSGIPDITPYAAAQIKPYLVEVVTAIRTRTAGLRPERVGEVASQVVREVRLRITTARHERRPALSIDRPRSTPWPAPADIPALSGAMLPNGVPRRLGDVDLAPLYDAVQTLAQMPSVGHTISLIPLDQHHRLSDLALAVRWLTGFAEQWTADHGQPVDAASAHCALAR
jgi:hypothetical protein